TANGNTTDTTIANNLLLGAAGSAANGISNNSGRMTNLTRSTSTACAGKPCPANIFVVNPTVAGASANVMTNDGSSYYDALQIEMRRRMSAGLSVQGSYVFAKALSNTPDSSSTASFNPTTLRNIGMDKSPSTFDIRHALKANWLY